MTERDERAVAAYVERFGNELTEALDVSPAAVSGAVQYLTQTHLIGKERERGSRRDVYVVHLDAWHEAMLSRDRLLGQMESAVRPVAGSRCRWSSSTTSRARWPTCTRAGSAAGPRSPPTGPPTPDPPA